MVIIGTRFYCISQLASVERRLVDDCSGILGSSLFSVLTFEGFEKIIIKIKGSLWFHPELQVIEQ